MSDEIFKVPENVTSDGIRQEDLRPQKKVYSLPADFYMDLVDFGDPTVECSIEELMRQNPKRQVIAQEVEKIVNESETEIQRAATRLVGTPNAKGNIFHDLVSTSFDEDEFIRRKERNMEGKRQTAQKASRKSN